MADLTKPNMNVVFLGSMDVGKSTLVGNLMFQTGAATQEDLDKIKQELGDSYDESMKFAYLLDEEKEERKLKKTINTNYKFIAGPEKNNFVLIDTPGDPAYSQNMIGEVSKGDVAVIVLSSCVKSFNKAFANFEIQSQIFLALAMSINQFIFCINFDKVNGANEDQDAIDTITYALGDWIKDKGLKIENPSFIPIMALGGDNIVKKSDKFPYYNGKPLLQELSYKLIPVRETSFALRLPISKIKGVNDDTMTLEGSIEYGKLTKGMELGFCPGRQTGTVTDISFFGNTVEEGKAGDFITFTVKGVDSTKIKRGQVVYDNESKDQAFDAISMEAMVVIANSTKGLLGGDKYELHFNTAFTTGTVVRVIGKMIEENLMYGNVPIFSNETGIVAFDLPKDQISADVYYSFPSCGKFAIKGDNGQIIGFGIVRNTTIAKAVEEYKEELNEEEG